jgi:cytoskeleton protein RodZ
LKMSDYYHQPDPSPDEEEPDNRVTPGELLAKKREESGLSHAMVGEALHLTVHYIKALEGNEYSKLPGQTFVKGYIRSYARFLQMDIPVVLACYEAHINKLGIEGSSQYGAGMRKRSDQTLLWAIAAGVVLAIALVTGWWFFGRVEGRPATATIQSGATPRPASTAAPVNAPDRSTTPAFNVSPLIESATRAADDFNESPGSIRETVGLDELVAVVATSSETPAVPEDADALAAQTSPRDEPVSAAASEPEVPASRVNAVDEQTGEVPVADDAGLSTVETAMVADTGPRHVNLVGEGNDLAEFSLIGVSWVEVNDADGNRLFQDMLRENDTLSIRGTAPFEVLLGDARNVSLVFNDADVDLDSSMRNDNTARLSLEAGGGVR